MREAVSQALKEAMKSRDAARVSALRMISAAFKDRDILARGQGASPASDEELVGGARQDDPSAGGIPRRPSTAAAGPELAAKERAEIEVIRGFLPKQMSEEEIRAAVQRGDRGDRRCLGPRHGQGHGAPEGAPRRKARFRQGERAREGRTLGSG